MWIWDALTCFRSNIRRGDLRGEREVLLRKKKMWYQHVSLFVTNNIRPEKQHMANFMYKCSLSQLHHGSEDLEREPSTGTQPIATSPVPSKFHYESRDKSFCRFRLLLFEITSFQASLLLSSKYFRPQWRKTNFPIRSPSNVFLCFINSPATTFRVFG